ncbi:VWA domain-containing protein [Roseateles sp. DAIF2]|uniref:vWA domain-containing protein n=1 Tax=Roseateles sp. DAIF2 TaxID=2714952 RepID=UPI0018A2B889|nr:VWA domain-containing protein [Roseateles sp. DAIF2]QPF71858.1 VWA domain-containing protein [Roseateles sp. DAIF2]
MADFLAQNVMHFGRVLRKAGMSVGTDRVQLALEALRIEGGIARRADFKATLAACLIDRAEHRALFEQAFYIFWRDPDLLGRVLAMLLPRVQARPGTLTPPPENRRLAEALFPRRDAIEPAREPEQRLELDAHLSGSERELLRQRDFETMTPEEWAQAKRALTRLRPWLQTRPTRRFRPGGAGRLDWRATLRAQARQELAPPRWRRPRERIAPLVILADISGSMSRYSRMLLHLAHGLANPAERRQVPRVHSFVFGTRLTPISRLLRQRDPDLAVAAVAQRVADWSGGTRIGACLHAFNRDWARRVLTSDATLLLVSDGLEAGDAAALEQLAFEARRLRLSCRRLLWLNPLLRFEGFEPKAAGIRALLPEVDSHLPAHNLASLEQLVELLLCN